MDQPGQRPLAATGGSRLGFILFNATFNNISAIILYLLVEETGVPRENHRPVIQCIVVLVFVPNIIKFPGR
jgi:hypothetical protein